MMCSGLPSPRTLGASLLCHAEILESVFSNTDEVSVSFVLFCFVFMKLFWQTELSLGYFLCQQLRLPSFDPLCFALKRTQQLKKKLYDQSLHDLRKAQKMILVYKNFCTQIFSRSHIPVTRHVIWMVKDNDLSFIMFLMKLALPMVPCWNWLQVLQCVDRHSASTLVFLASLHPHRVIREMHKLPSFCCRFSLAMKPRGFSSRQLLWKTFYFDVPLYSNVLFMNPIWH